MGAVKAIAFFLASLLAYVTGIVFFAFSALPLIALFGLYALALTRNRQTAIRVSITAFAIVALMIFSSIQYTHGLPIIFALFVFPLAYLLAEGHLIKAIYRTDNLWKPLLKVKLRSVIFFAIVSIPLSGLQNGMAARLRSQAKGTLRSIGTAQLDYQSQNEDHRYGSFEDLQAVQAIAQGYWQSDLIEGYSLSWQVSNVPTGDSQNYPPNEVNTFTVIAWPRDRSPGFLATYGITEEQIVRVYNPDSSNKVDSVGKWDPIL